MNVDGLMFVCIKHDDQAEIFVEFWHSCSASVELPWLTIMPRSSVPDQDNRSSQNRILARGRPHDAAKVPGLRSRGIYADIFMTILPSCPTSMRSYGLSLRNSIFSGLTVKIRLKASFVGS